jgi:hypothetical protein
MISIIKWTICEISLLQNIMMSFDPFSIPHLVEKDLVGVVVVDLSLRLCVPIILLWIWTYL